MRKLRNKGYFFIIDAFIGSTIIFLSLMIILNSGAQPTKIQYNYELAEEYIAFMMDTQIKDISNNLVSNMTAEKQINNTEYTLVEQVDRFYFDGDITNARRLVENVSEPLIPAKYGFSYSIVEGGVTTNIYNRSSINITNANIVISSKKITFLNINSTTMFGPAAVEVKIWI